MGMRKHVIFIGKSAIFLCLLGMIVCGVNQILVKKYLYNGANALTEAQYDFYEMERDSVDVLFLGSSHSGSAFSPWDLYDEYNITSYNFSSSGQSIWISYYWLKEALQYQSPQVVVLDCYQLWFDNKNDEASAHKALDSMRSGIVKLEAIDTVCDFDERQSRLSYFLTNIRYHERWKELNETDFNWKDNIDPPSKMKGFYLSLGKCGYQDYEPIEIRESEIYNFLPEKRFILIK